jgi:hypothetical protein
MPFGRPSGRRPSPLYEFEKQSINAFCVVTYIQIQILGTTVNGYYISSFSRYLPINIHSPLFHIPVFTKIFERDAHPEA